MKKFLILVLLLAMAQSQAQENSKSSAILSRKNELRVDVVGLAMSRVNLTYERFLNKNFSVGLSGIFSGNKKNKDDFDSGNVGSFTKTELIPFVRYNLSQGARSFYFAEVFLDANSGDYREILLLTNASNNNYYAISKSRYSDLGAGVSVGYKYYIQDRFGIEFLVGGGWNLFNRDQSPDVLSRVGIGVSYRF